MLSQLGYIAIGVGLLLFVGWLDYITGPEVSLLVFYFLPWHLSDGIPREKSPFSSRLLQRPYGFLSTTS